MALLTTIFGAPLDGDLPLFPDRAGNVMEKKRVVKTLEATVAMTGEAVVDETGANLFGGHSLRVSGARMLASLGIEVAKKTLSQCFA